MNNIIFMYLGISMLLLNCNKISNENDHIHPNIQNITETGQHSGINRVLIDSTYSYKTFDMLTDSYNQVTIGEAYGSLDNSFGRIIDVETDKYDRIYILDYIRQEIKVYDQNGDLITTLGGRGDGPGEFRRARSMTVYDDKWLYVGNGYRIERFNIEADIPFYEDSILMERNVRNICVISDHLYVHNVQILDNVNFSNDRQDFELPIIHTYKLPELTHISSFGNAYYSKNSMVIENMSLGELSCNANRGVIYFIYERIPVVKAYSLYDHELKWISNFTEIKHSLLIEETINDRQAVRHHIEGNYVDRLISILPLNDQNLLVQYQRAFFDENDRQAGAVDFKVLSFLLDTSTGSGSQLIDIDRNLIHINDEYLISVNNEHTILRVGN